jgi:hypothetical protein
MCQPVKQLVSLSTTKLAESGTNILLMFILTLTSPPVGWSIWLLMVGLVIELTLMIGMLLKIGLWSPVGLLLMIGLLLKNGLLLPVGLLLMVGLMNELILGFESVELLPKPVRNNKSNHLWQI